MKSIMLQLVPVLSLLIHTVAADVPNPVFWERAFTINITNANNEGTLNQSTSFMATSQDFQGIHIDANPKNPPDVSNFRVIRSVNKAAYILSFFAENYI